MQQFSDRFLVGVIFRRAFFQHQTELFPEGLVFFRVVFRQFSSICRTQFRSGRCADYALPCCSGRISRETFNGRSLESIRPRTNADSSA